MNKYSHSFKIYVLRLTLDAIKVLHSICQQIWKTKQWPQDYKRSVFIKSIRKTMLKNVQIHNCTHLNASKVILKILQASLQQYVNQEIPDVQSGFRKGRGSRDQIVNICWIIKKSKRVPGKYLLLLYWLHQSLWLCGSQQTVENYSTDGNTRPPDLPPEKSVCRSRSNS